MAIQVKNSDHTKACIDLVCIKCGVHVREIEHYVIVNNFTSKKVCVNICDMDFTLNEAEAISVHTSCFQEDYPDISKKLKELGEILQVVPHFADS